MVECYIAARHLDVDLMVADIHLAVAAADAAPHHLPERMRFAVVAVVAAADNHAAVAGLALAVRFQSSALHR